MLCYVPHSAVRLSACASDRGRIDRQCFIERISNPKDSVHHFQPTKKKKKQDQNEPQGRRATNSLNRIRSLQGINLEVHARTDAFKGAKQTLQTLQTIRANDVERPFCPRRLTQATKLVVTMKRPFANYSGVLWVGLPPFRELLGRP